MNAPATAMPPLRTGLQIVSGSKPLAQRPVGAELWAAIQRGDTVITAKLDRMFGDATDALNCLHAMSLERHILPHRRLLTSRHWPPGHFQANYPNERQLCKVRTMMVRMTATTEAAVNRLHVLIVDDHPVVLSGCRAILSQDASIHMIEASNAEAAFALYQRHEPDVTVIDINLPGRSGFDLGHRILRANPRAKLIFFSMNDDPIFAAKAIEYGAKGYVSKTDDPRDFLGAIREVASGGVFLDPAIARKLAFREGPIGANPLLNLSERELEILRLMARGNTLAEIAETLGTSYKTVANSASMMKRKLAARTPMDLVRIALAHGLG